MNAARLEFPVANPPEPGHAVPLAAGVHWLRLPVPGPLRHINVWLLEDGDGWTLVDTGMQVPAALAAWQGPLHEYLRGRPLARIICTHHHPDHAGLASWLAARHGATVYMTAVEHGLMRRLALVWQDSAAAAARVADFVGEGLEPSAELQPTMALEGYRRMVSGIPDDVRYLAAGDVVDIGGRSWRALVVRGHTDGQLLLHDAGGGLLIAGDQVLPRITTNVGIYPERDDPAPLESFLGSFAALAALDPEPLVLPSHGNVFRGLRLRLAQLQAHHAEELDTVARIVVAPMTATEIARQLFRAPLDPLNTVLALGETRAHLAHLCARGRVRLIAEPGAPRRYAPTA